MPAWFQVLSCGLLPIHRSTPQSWCSSLTHALSGILWFNTSVCITPLVTVSPAMFRPNGYRRCIIVKRGVKHSRVQAVTHACDSHARVILPLSCNMNPICNHIHRNRGYTVYPRINADFEYTLRVFLKARSGINAWSPTGGVAQYTWLAPLQLFWAANLATACVHLRYATLQWSFADLVHPT